MSGAVDEKKAHEQRLKQAAERAAAAERADQAAKDAQDPSLPRPGKPLPEDFINPPCGDDRHLCVDLNGNYRPDWKQLLLMRATDQQAQTQFIAYGTKRNVRVKDPKTGETRIEPRINREKWYLRCDRWADVPPGVVRCLEDAQYDEIQQDFDPAQDATLLPVSGAPKKIVTKRRFPFQVKASA